jgi:hypothetical protein
MTENWVKLHLKPAFSSHVPGPDGKCYSTEVAAQALTYELAFLAPGAPGKLYSSFSSYLEAGCYDVVARLIGRSGT